ncbi:hypothetical protein PHYPSEUDO_002456 [Phytophthora pseudosyringae]|uniref:Uncharacterized protein n=1 Tax=Phytophthora pseudosyringae TaxID=221518 RepID=A0A8T1VUD4_9STRA|nr:hypothetical protein PHYPSEUDO_002456 [Phytophthora pseudosyringae]
MLFLPLEEDSLLFRLCLYYGGLVLLLELLVPLLFQRRVRIEIPRLALRAPAVPLSTREFQHRRLALQQQVAALQRALAETPHPSPQKRRQQLPSVSAAKQQPAASPSPSPTSSVKVTRPKSSRKTSRAKRGIEKNQVQEEDGGGSRRRGEDEGSGPAESKQKARQPPMAMSDSLATRSARRGGFSFDEVREEAKGDEKRDGQEEWTQAVDRRIARRRESPTFSGWRPVRLVEDREAVGYSGLSEAAARLEALIGARMRRKAATLTSYEPPPVTAPAPIHAPVPVAPDVAVAKPAEHTAPKPVPQEVAPPLGQHSATDEDEETKESEQSEPLTDFQAFCASFATGGSATAQQAAVKRKHQEAFGSDTEHTNGSASIAMPKEKRKHPRVLGQDIGEPKRDTAAPTPQSVDKRTYHEAFGSDDEKEIDDVVAAQQVVDKRSHDQAFGATTELERPQEKTPRIVRRISFGDEVDGLAASSPNEVAGERSTGKHKHKQAFSMLDDEDEDAEWRDSLAFRHHHFG